MNIIDRHWFRDISRPSRYMGNEVNACLKDPSRIEISFALCFPDVYEVGMSHLGLKILYQILNENDWISAERAFCPWVDLEKELRKNHIGLSTLESNRPLFDFDIVGFSLQHELSFTNVLTMLDLAGIPLLASERKNIHPLIIAGGPACFNPEPVADIFDLFVIGDGEKSTLEICREYRKVKKAKISSRQELLSRVGKIEGVYIPSFFSIQYKEDGRIKAVKPLVSGHEVIRKSIVADIDLYPPPQRLVIPFTELVHDRIAIEISRGCTRGCRFCQAGMIYRPVRERHPDFVVEGAESALKCTGYDDLSLLSLSSGDYSLIKPILKTLMDRLVGKKISISLPSLRVDSMDPSWMEQIKRVRKTGFTLAAEAGNDRMRRIINKGLTDHDIISTAQIVYRAGWKLIKLYFMIGLPGETDRDIYDIINIAKEISRLADKKSRRNNLNVSISTFVPKSHTPFMWLPQITLEESRRRIKIVRDGLTGPVRVKWNEAELSWLEGIFSRGDRRLCDALIKAFKIGARFDAWGEQFRMDIWQRAFKETGLEPDFYLHRKRSLEEILPWDHISSGVKKEFLKMELERAEEEKTTPDCRINCLDCGVCDHTRVSPRLHKGWDSSSLSSYKELQAPIEAGQSERRYRLTFTKMGNCRYLSHLELSKVLNRAFRRAGLDFVYSRGYHPLPKVSFSNALPVGTESMHETVEILLVKEYEPDSLKELINSELPSGIQIQKIEARDLKKPADNLIESYFKVFLNGLSLEQEVLTRFLQMENFPVVKLNKKGEHTINARFLVKSIRLASPNTVELAVRHTSGPQLRPSDIIKHVFSLSDDDVGRMKILKTKEIFGLPER